MYNEPMLEQAGIKAPAKSWDELVEHCTKLKRDKVSDTPFLPNWNSSPSGTMPQFMTDCFSEGAQVFDAKNRVIVDQEPGAAKAMERWQKVYKAELVNPEVLTKTSSTDTHRLFWTGRYAYHTNHSYYLKTIAGEPENSKLAPKKAKMAMYPGTGQTYMWTDSYTVNGKTKVLEDAWKLTRFLGGNLNGDWYVQRQWCLISGLDNPYPEMYDHPEIIAVLRPLDRPEAAPRAVQEGQGHRGVQGALVRRVRHQGRRHRAEHHPRHDRPSPRASRSWPRSKNRSRSRLDGASASSVRPETIAPAEPAVRAEGALSAEPGPVHDDRADAAPRGGAAPRGRLPADRGVVRVPSRAAGAGRHLPRRRCSRCSTRCGCRSRT